MTLHTKFGLVVKRRLVRFGVLTAVAWLGCSSTNHVAALLFRIEAAVRDGFTIPAYTEKAKKWLPDRRKVLPMKWKDIDFSRDDFGKRGKKDVLLFQPPRRAMTHLWNVK